MKQMILASKGQDRNPDPHTSDRSSAGQAAPPEALRAVRQKMVPVEGLEPPTS